MTDQERPDDVPEFDDPAYDALRELLASARVTEPVPDDVVARLDGTLAALTADRRDGAGPSVDQPVVVPLRRRARWAPRLLAAAAAVVVLGGGGIGIAQMLGNEGSDLTTSGSADSPTTESDDSGDFGPAPTAPEAEGPQDLDLDRLVDQSSKLLNSKGVPRFTAAGFAREVAAFSTRDLTRLMSATAATKGTDTQSENGPPALGPATGTTPTPTDGTLSGGAPQEFGKGGSYSYRAAKAACPGPVGIGAILVPVLYDGAPAALAVYPVTGDTQLYEAWTCDGRTRLDARVIER